MQIILQILQKMVDLMNLINNARLLKSQAKPRKNVDLALRPVNNQGKRDKVTTDTYMKERCEYQDWRP